MDTTGFDTQYFTSLGISNARIDAENELLRSLIPDAGKVLDVGSGKGRIERLYPNVTSADVTPEAAQYVKNFVQCSMTDLPFPENTFDTVFCLHVLAHFPDGERGISEARRVLKPGGKLVIITPNKYYVYFSWFVTALKHFRFKYDRTARWLYSSNSLLSIMKNWSDISVARHQKAPRFLPFEWMRPKIVIVATK